MSLMICFLDADIMAYENIETHGKEGSEQASCLM